MRRVFDDSTLPPEILLCGASPSHDVKCFAVGHAVEVGAALPDQLQRQIWPKTVDLGQVDTEDRMQCRARVEGRSVRLARLCSAREAACRGSVCALFFSRFRIASICLSQAVTFVW